jgi:hypothetical protein
MNEKKCVQIIRWLKMYGDPEHVRITPFCNGKRYRINIADVGLIGRCPECGGIPVFQDAWGQEWEIIDREKDL